MSSEQERRELDAKAKQGETVVPGGTGGKSLEAQEHLAEGNPFVSLACGNHFIYIFCANWHEILLVVIMKGGAAEGRRGRSSWGLA
jgi:hypothetical protein